MELPTKFAALLIGIAISATLTASQQVADENRPFLRVLAPAFICPEERVTQNVSNRVTISLQTSEGQRLKYNIAIDFEILDGFQNQRHTLSIWKHVRELQAKFATQSVSDEISLKNQIEIDAKEVSGKAYKVGSLGHVRETQKCLFFTQHHVGERVHFFWHDVFRSH